MLVIIRSLRGVRDRVVRVVDLELLASYRCGFEFRHVPWIFSCGADLRNVGGSAQGLGLLVIMNGGAPEVILNQ